MRASQWFRPPHHLLSLFLGMTLTLAATLGWLGWRLFDQDRALERQRIRDHLESAGNLVGSALVRRLTDTEEPLRSLAGLTDPQLPSAAAKAADTVGDDAVIVVLRAGSVTAYPPARLAYSPVAPPAVPVGEPFAAGEALEFQQQNFTGAAAAFRVLSRSSDLTVRAAAVLRVARNLRKSRQPDAALGVYDGLIRLGSTLVDGLPAELVARHARCTVYEQLDRSDDLRREATALDACLEGRRWLLTRAAFLFYREECRRWLGAGSRGGGEAAARDERALALAEAVESLWNEWQTGRSESAGGGRRTLWLRDRSVLMLWRGGPDRIVGLVAGPEYLRRQLIGSVQPLIDREGVELALTDREGRHIEGPSIGHAPEQVVRAETETQLPWNLHLFNRDDRRDPGALTPRRRLLAAGLAAMGIFVLAGSALIARAITRELRPRGCRRTLSLRCRMSSALHSPRCCN